VCLYMAPSQSYLPGNIPAPVDPRMFSSSFSSNHGSTYGSGGRTISMLSEAMQMIVKEAVRDDLQHIREENESNMTRLWERLESLEAEIEDLS